MPDEYYLSTGTLTENTNYINMCRTQVRVKMNTPADYFLKNHWVITISCYKAIMKTPERIPNGKLL